MGNLSDLSRNVNKYLLVDLPKLPNPAIQTGISFIEHAVSNKMFLADICHWTVE